MKTYTTFQGARRAARIGRSQHYRPILRVLDGTSTEDLFIVLDDMRTTLHAVDDMGRTDGSITFLTLSTLSEA